MLSYFLLAVAVVLLNERFPSWTCSRRKYGKLSFRLYGLHFRSFHWLRLWNSQLSWACLMSYKAHYRNYLPVFEDLFQAGPASDLRYARSVASVENFPIALNHWSLYLYRHLTGLYWQSYRLQKSSFRWTTWRYWLRFFWWNLVLKLWQLFSQCRLEPLRYSNPSIVPMIRLLP